MSEYQKLAKMMAQQDGVEESTMMASHCLRYRGQFMAMWFDKEESLIIKVPAARVNELVESGQGNEFNFTRKRFKEWVLIPLEYADKYSAYLQEALEYARSR